MVLETEQVIAIIKNGVSDRIADARVYSDLLNMHVTGHRIEEYTEKFNNHENDDQRKLREKLLKSNKATFSLILRPLDKIFTAKGGAVNYNLQENQIEIVKEAVANVSDGLDIKTFLKKKVKQHYIINPNGFLMTDISEDGSFENKIYTEHDVIWYDNTGNQINALIFNHFINEDNENDDKKYYRVIDAKTDSIWIQDGEVIYQDEDSILDNFFGYVPTYILGDVNCTNTNKFLSLIDDVLDDAKEHLRDVSVNVVHKLSHGYAKYWQYPESCTTCGGSGEIKTKVDGEVTTDTCHTCEGGGTKNKKDASDLLLIPIPQDGEQKIAPEVGGYINPSIEIWKQYKEDIADLKLSMFNSLWGTIYSSQGENETATSHLLNAQPEAERVSGISRTFSKLHEFFLDSVGKVVLGKIDYKSSVTYGTRYLMESSDAVLERFTTAKKEGLPILLQNDLLDKFYQTEHQNNNQEYIKTKKIISVDPFPSMSAQDVKDLGVSGNDLYIKIYYPQWVNQLSEAKKILMTVEQLKEDLKNYTLIKIKENGTIEVQQGAE